MATTRRRSKKTPSNDLVPRFIDPDSILVRTALEVLAAHAPAEDTPADAFVICAHCGELSPCAAARNAIDVCLASGTRPRFARHQVADIERTKYGVARRTDNPARKLPKQSAKPAAAAPEPAKQAAPAHQSTRPGPIRRWMALIEPTSMFGAIRRNGPTVAEPEPYDPEADGAERIIDGSGWSPAELEPDDNSAFYQEQRATV